jgi:hypothetical protein
MSPEQWDGIRHFYVTELQRPLDMDNEFMVFLDGVRQQYGEPLVVTSDARTVAEEETLPGHAIPPHSSLHVADPANGLWGRAVDLRWIADGTSRWKFLQAVYNVANGRGVELEFVPFGDNAHIHVGLFRTARPSVFIFSEV